MLNIYTMIDIAAVCEEVVEDVYAALLYQRDGSPADGMQSIVKAKKKVKIIIDIEKADFKFVTQAGALRRVIMNTFGNALKYTEQGTIEVKLRLQCHNFSGNGDWSNGEENAESLILTITDTGKGISSEYMRTRLYTPFAQEDGLVPGAGLGLSITRSIVTMLGGEIEIRSQLGQGTEVEITLPLGGIDPDSRQQESVSKDDSSEKAVDSFKILRERYASQTIGLYGFGVPDIPGLQESKSEVILKEYISNWYEMVVLTSWGPTTHVNTILVEEENLSDLLSRNTRLHNVVVLISSPLDSGSKKICRQTGVLEYLSKPFGPYKLAKALRLCLEKAEPFKNDGINPQLKISHLALTTPTIEAVTNNVHLVDEKASYFSLISKTQATLPSLLGSNSIAIPSATAVPARKEPKILLVEDNKINLRLLESFVSKRKYKDVSTAENGQLAVETVEQHEQGYDIIFMGM